LRIVVMAQLAMRRRNFCAAGLCPIASANHATACIAAASAASCDL
jgi:hypothetical protein